MKQDNKEIREYYKVYFDNCKRFKREIISYKQFKKEFIAMRKQTQTQEEQARLNNLAEELDKAKELLE